MNSSLSASKARRAAPGFFLTALAFAPLAVPLTIPLALTGCDRAPAPAAGPTHTVRGKVMKLPVAGEPSSSFSLFHETIPQWLRPDGTRGMNAMIMPFPLAKGVSIEGIAVDDLVELTVVQHPKGPVPYEATSVKKLPPETRLQLPEVGK